MKFKSIKTTTKNIHHTHTGFPSPWLVSMSRFFSFRLFVLVPTVILTSISSSNLTFPLTFFGPFPVFLIFPSLLFAEIIQIISNILILSLIGCKTLSVPRRTIDKWRVPCKFILKSLILFFNGIFYKYFNDSDKGVRLFVVVVLFLMLGFLLFYSSFIKSV